MCFPRINEISNELLREGVIRIWQRSLREIKYHSISDIPFRLEIHDIALANHTRSVTDMALVTALPLEERFELRADPDILRAAVTLHDVSKVVETAPVESGEIKKSETGKNLPHVWIRICRALQVGLPLVFRQPIAAHPYYSPIRDRPIEGAMLHYADFAVAGAMHLPKGLRWNKNK